jgi:hypothetical protein
MDPGDTVFKYLVNEGICEIIHDKGSSKWTEWEPKAKFNEEKHILHGTRVRMIKLSLSDSSFVSLQCSLHCTTVQFATWGLFPSINCSHPSTQHKGPSVAEQPTTKLPPNYAIQVPLTP